MFRPRKCTEPESGFRNPDSNANNVVLPAPLGPTRAVRDPCGTSRLTSCTAFRPPKATDRLRACNKASDTDALLETEPAPQGAADAADAARQEHHDDDQHHAVDHHADARELPEQVAGQLGQHMQN